MTIGRFEGYQATLPVTFRFAGGRRFSITFVLDTGFSGFLTLPPAAVAALGLPFDTDININLADGSDAVVAAHLAVIEWRGQETPVRVLATGKRPLLGVGLLMDGELLVQFQEGGLVTLDEI